jgi:hypothetical protein
MACKLWKEVDMNKAVFICLNVLEEMEESALDKLGEVFDYIIQVYDQHSSHYEELPQPGLAYKMAVKYELDLSSSLVIGKNSGITNSILVGGLIDREGIRFVGNLPAHNMGNVSGELVPDNLLGKIEENEVGMKYINFRKDNSDKDAKFAKNAGMKYMDFNKFLSTHFHDYTTLMYYTK